MSRAGIESGLDLLSNETRFDILRALATQRFDEGGTSRMTFTDLFESVGTDDSGNFNYHLNRLIDRLVTKEGEYYRLTYGGVQLFSWLQAATYAPGYAYDAIPLDHQCPLCENELTATYEEGHMDIGCEDHWLLGTYVHPRWVESLSTDELIQHVSLRLQHHIELIANRICPLCSGTLERFLRTDHDPYPIQYHYPCTQCGAEPRLRPPQTVMRDVRVEQFYRERGVELHETPPWKLYATYEDSQVVSEDSLHVRCELVVDGDAGFVTVDGLGNVISFDTD